MKKTDQLLTKGFRVPSNDVPRRLVCSIEGLDKTGKTHLALSAPAPVIYISIDAGDEGVIHKFQGKDILQYDVGTRPLQIAPTGKDEYAKIWADFRSCLVDALSLREGTVVIDTASEAYELCRLAHFGKLTNVMPHNYAEVNSEWREIVRWGYDSGMSMVLIHKLKSKWTDNKRTNEMEPQGMTEIGYLVQACIRMEILDGQNGQGPSIQATIRTCRHNLNVSGTVIPWEVLQGGGFEAILDEVHGQ